MARLDELVVNSLVKGILPSGPVTIVNSQRLGDEAISIFYKDNQGNTGSQILYKDHESDLEIVTTERPWSFNGDGAVYRLASEAKRIKLAFIFDKRLAVHTSIVEPLPHQIEAVYGEMLPRQPLRFLLADDPGAGKTIMAGLLLKELMIRGDVERCLIICPGNLVEQWQDELYQKFNLPFEIMTNESYEASLTGNWFSEKRLVICRLDKLSRNEDVLAKLEGTEWDMVICDEAHKMSAHFFGGEASYTKRYKLGKKVSGKTRHFLLLTATPHNGKEEDFQLFMSLLDGDRFEGKFRDGVHIADTSDLLRRMVKEDLVRFDGTRLFPERRAYTVAYQLSDAEAALYSAVTEYVVEEFNRAEALENKGRKRTVGFALTILQRRLASSPEAIHRSLINRRNKLEKQLREEKILKRGAQARVKFANDFKLLTEDDIDEIDDLTEEEEMELEDELLKKASAAETIAELEAEIATLNRLESMAKGLKMSGADKKWEELSSILQNDSEMFDAKGHRRKLIIFTEHRATLDYLSQRIRTMLGRDEAVVTIHGGMGREQRANAEQGFLHDKGVGVLVATDAAGEGINLQRAHLMVNYDLPWNPNRLEQRFGRIHRIGQTEVCHLWNMVANDTREGDVYIRLLEKLKIESEALGGKVFDVIGKMKFEDKPLRDILIEAIRYGDKPDVRKRLEQVVDSAFDPEYLQTLFEQNALATDSIDARKLQKIRQDMERAEARRLQPHFIEAFFKEAFAKLGGTMREREQKRYEISNVPSIIRQRDRLMGRREAVQKKYERVTFEKELISIAGKPSAAYICPGHPLLDAVIDIVLERNGNVLRQGSVLVDDGDLSKDIRLLVCFEHSVMDAKMLDGGGQRVISRIMQFVEMDKAGQMSSAGYAPYLDYRPLADEEETIAERLPMLKWTRLDIDEKVSSFAVNNLVRRHLQEKKEERAHYVEKTIKAVRDRLTKEINYWDYRAEDLKESELAGKGKPKISSAYARKKAEELTERLRIREAELEAERKVSAGAPVIVGGAMIVPRGLIVALLGKEKPEDEIEKADRRRIEEIAMNAVVKTEESLGYMPHDISSQNMGYDIESAEEKSGKLRFIEVKGRHCDAKTVAVTRNETLTALNKPDDYILALVLVKQDTASVFYIANPFEKDVEFTTVSVNHDIDKLLKRAQDMGSYDF